MSQPKLNTIFKTVFVVIILLLIGIIWYLLSLTTKLSKLKTQYDHLAIGPTDVAGVHIDSGTLSGATIDAQRNTIRNLTNANLSGSAGITNNNILTPYVDVLTLGPLQGGTQLLLGGGLTLSCPSCLTPSSGVASLNGLVGSITVTGTANQVIVTNASGNTITLSLPQDINTSSSPTFASLAITGDIISGGNLSVAGSTTLTNTVTINGVVYTWPAVQSNGVLANDGLGNLAWQPTGACATCITNGGNGFGLPISIGTNDANTLALRTSGVDRLSITTAGDASFSGTLAVNGASLSVGSASTTNGALVLNNSTNAFTTTLQAPSTTVASKTISLPDENGTVCLQNAASCGFTIGSGNAFVQGGNSFGATATLGTNDSNSLAFETNNTTQGIIAVGGAVTFQNSTDSTTGFRVLDADGGTAVLAIDTTNEFVAVGGTPANSILTVGTDTTTAAGGLTLGTDTNLYRSAANRLKTDGSLIVDGVADAVQLTVQGHSTQTANLQSWQSSAGANYWVMQSNGTFYNSNQSSGTIVISTRASGDTSTRFSITNNGVLNFGSGSAATDTNLYRVAADSLKTDDSLNVAGSLLTLSGSSTNIWQNNSTSLNNAFLRSKLDTDATNRYQVLTKGEISWGDGTSAVDTNLYRSAADTLKTDDSLAIGTLGAANTANYLCRNAASLIANCNTTGTGAAFVQGGNTFGALATLGTNDANGLAIETNNTTQATIAVGGAVTYQNSADTTTGFRVMDADGGTPVLNVDTTNERVGIGTAAPTVTLDVLSADADATTVAQFKNAGATSCTVQPGGTGFACSSDAQLKTNVLNLTNASDIVTKLQGVSFNWISDPNGQTQDGFIAQDLQKLIPNSVSTDSNGYLVANYSAIIPFLVEALKNTNSKVENLEQQVAQGVLSGGVVLADTEFKGQAVFDALTSFKGKSVFTGGATFDGDTKFNGDVSFNPDTAGVTIIEAGAKSSSVAFSKALSTIPVVTATPQDFISGQFKVTNITKSGFTILTSENQTEDIQFSWTAIQNQ